MLPNGDLRRSTKVTNWQLQLHIYWMLSIGDFSRSLDICQMTTSIDTQKSPIGNFSCTSVECCQLATLADPLKVANWRLSTSPQCCQMATYEDPRKSPIGNFSCTSVQSCQLETSATKPTFYIVKFNAIFYIWFKIRSAKLVMTASVYICDRGFHSKYVFNYLNTKLGRSLLNAHRLCITNW